MRTIRNIMAVLLIGSAFVAYQGDAGAQTRRGETRSTSTSGSATRSSSVNRSSSSSVKRQPAARPSTQTRQPSVQSRPSTQTKPSVQAKPSTQTRPSVQTRPSTQRQPSVQTRPSTQTKPSAQTKPSVQTRPSVGAQNNRPQSGASVDRKPSNTVKSPGDRISVNRPGHRPGDRKPSSGPAMGPNKPGHRPSAGSAFKPDKHKPPVKVYPNHKHDRPRVHPVRRDFITYDRPSSFWNHHHHHYFGYRVRVLPARAKIFRHHGIAYYCYNDIWYRPYGSYYVICRPPFGTVLAANLIHDLAWTAVRFSYYNTVFSTYRQINENNSYIAEQNEIIAKNNAIIAAQNQTIAMNQAQAAASVTAANDLGLVQSYAAADGEYFYQDGVFYAKDKSGEYKVIVPPAGALVESLPDDYEMITIKGTEYYKVDDTVYKVVLSEGKPVFEVMGQLFS